MRIPVADPRASIDAHRGAVDEVVARVLDGGWYILGPEVEAFEEEFARFMGVDHAVGVASGTDALELALRACGVEAGDGVATVSHTATATVAAIERAGATPVLVDIDPDTYNMDPAHLDATIQAVHNRRIAVDDLQITAVVVVHLYGRPADWQLLREVASRHGLVVIEDCAQAHGALWQGRPVGSLGDAAAFSFYPTKNLGAVGDGGMVVTGDAETAERLRRVRQYGWRDRYVSEHPGVNSRLDELQAAILRVLLPHLEPSNQHRRAVADTYRVGLQDSSLRLPDAPDPEEAAHVYHQFVVRHESREALREALGRAGIGTAVHYPRAIHQQPAYERLARLDDLPETTRAVREIVSLPMGVHVNPEDAHEVVEAIMRWQAANE